MHSLSGLILANYRNPSGDYDTILRVVLGLTKNIQEVESAYALASFNVLAHMKLHRPYNQALINRMRKGLR